MSNSFFLVKNGYNKKRSPEIYNIVEENLNLTDNVDNADYILVLGGDGSLLDSIQKYKYLDKPILGIHTGSVGYYMHNLKKEEILKLKDSKLDIVNFPMLNFIAEDIHGNIFEGDAFSDVWVERGQQQSLKYTLCVLSDKYSKYCNLNKDLIIGDGILFSTPAGSTGYTKNLGGKIIPFEVPIFQVVPMASAINKKHLQSFALCMNSNKVEVNLEDSDFRKGNLIYDGLKAKNNHSDFIPEKITVKKSNIEVKLAFLNIEDFRQKTFSWMLE